MSERTKAIDLYSGIGGWSLGLRLAGIDVCASYERSEAANETNRLNNGHACSTVDIRKMDLDDLPADVAIVVGSPPCTQFSFSNRGGSGDLSEGLADVIRFLTIVDHLKPKKWVMENVPRLSRILDRELKDGGILERFRHLNIRYDVFNMENFGLPQRRRRCIVGNIDLDLLRSYERIAPNLTLGSVIYALNNDPAEDVIFGQRMSRSEIHDHDIEESLNVEELRINSAAKLLHPIYNSMPFPDSLDRAARTVTATCTRVSRESIIIEIPANSGDYRRLSVRERAGVQGFPLSFQFYGSSHGQKLKMIGNAIPPSFAYFVAHAIMGTSRQSIPSLSTHSSRIKNPPAPPSTLTHKRGFQYHKNRVFKYSIESLRLKSGVRFELNNNSKSGNANWNVAFVFGTSKVIRKIVPKDDISTFIINEILREAKTEDILSIISRSRSVLDSIDIAHMQDVWSHKGPGATRPFMLLDLLNEMGRDFISSFLRDEIDTKSILLSALQRSIDTENETGIAKLLQNSPIILAGFLVGGIANSSIMRGETPVDAAPAARSRRASV